MKLKPCPFCGSENIQLEQYRRDGVVVKCKKCLFQKKQRTLRHDIEWLENTLIKDWNTRHHPTCSECKDFQEEIGEDVWDWCGKTGEEKEPHNYCDRWESKE